MSASVAGGPTSQESASDVTKLIAAIGASLKVETSRGATTLMDMPGEILLDIASFIEVRDVISLRKTCTSFFQLTNEKSLWLSLFRSQRRVLPVPYPLYILPSSRISSYLRTLSKANIESMVLSADQTNRMWLRPRIDSITVAKTPYRHAYPTRTILMIDFILDRWLVMVDHEASVEIWDHFSSAIPATHSDHGVGVKWNTEGPLGVLYARTSLQRMGLCSSATACFDNDRCIIVAVTSPSNTSIIRVTLGLADDFGRLQTICILPTPTTGYLLRALDPASEFIAYSCHYPSICLVHWPTQLCWSFHVGEEEEEELWSGIIGLKFIDRQHVLCVKTRSVELYALDMQSFPSRGLSSKLSSDNQSNSSNRSRMNRQCRHGEARLIRHLFPETTFRGISFSGPRSVISSSGSITASVSFLAYDVLRGLFHYRVDVHLPPSLSSNLHVTDGTSLHMDVTALAVHHMAQSVTADPGTAQQSDRGPPTTPRSGFSPGARGFVSACVLGRQGKRGVWVERQRGSVRRVVYGFNTSSLADPERSDADQDTKGYESGRESEGQPDADVVPDSDSSSREDLSKAEPIAGACLYEISSYDLGDDITHCTFSEVTGKIILGTRYGELKVL